MAMAKNAWSAPGMGWALDSAALRARVRGEVVATGDSVYEQARTIHGAAFDCRPAVIVRCAEAADVRAAITFARAHDLPLAVRSGGHSMAGHSTCDDGVVINLSPMRAITVDPARRLARIEPGATWGEVAAALHPYGLALTSGDTGSVGVGGLALGGGIGWMARTYGLTIDRLRAVEIMTADGQLLRASATQNAELFWGLRGGGGNFGVATAFEFDLHSGGLVLGGAIFYAVDDAARLASLLHAYANTAAAAPDELTTIAFVMPAPPAPFIPPERRGTPVMGIAVCYAGNPADGTRAVEPLRALGTPLADLIAPMPYPALFALTAEAAVPGHQAYLRSLFLDSIDESAFDSLAAATMAVMAPGTVAQVRVLGGAVSRVAPHATAFAHRDKPLWMTVLHHGPADADATDLRERTERVWQALRPYAAGVYANFLGDEGEARVREAYPPATYARLATLKRRYDPDNLFRLNQNVRPR